MERVCIPFLEEKDFYLREPQESDLSGNWYQWFNDANVTRYQNKKLFPNTLEKQTSYFNFIQTSKSDVVLAIIDRTSKKHVGNVGLHNIDWVHRSAELGIVIGENDFRGHGYGKLAWKLMTGYGFNTLNLHRIMAILMAGNIGSEKCARFSGFQKEGEIREMFFKDGKYLDGYYYNVLKRDFV